MSYSFSLKLFTFFVVCLASSALVGQAVRTEYYMGVVFRETPYSDIIGANAVSKEETDNKKHFELSFDAEDRLVEVQYVLNGRLAPFDDRFVRAPKTQITYKGDWEIRRYFDVEGHRTLVSGNVYETMIRRNADGQRTHLHFLDVSGKPIANDFNITRYEWEEMTIGEVKERRFDDKDSIQRNRPGFGYLVTMFSFHSNGLLKEMVNLGLDGTKPTPDQSGVVKTRIGYDKEGRFVQWLNLDDRDQPIKGMSQIAEIKYLPSSFQGEAAAWFLDDKGEPQKSSWGAHKVGYDFDVYGNPTHQYFYGLLEEPVNADNGIGEIRTTWSSDGRIQTSRSFFDKDGNKVGIGRSQLHRTVTALDSISRPVKIGFYNLNDEPVNNERLGYASENLTYDSLGRLILRVFKNVSGEKVDHAVWGFAQVNYSYLDDELVSVKYQTSENKRIQPTWNPAH